MATGWKGLALGALGLAALQAVIGGDTPAAQQASASRVGGLATGAGNLARKFLSPDVPAFKTPVPATTSATGVKPAVATTTGPAPTPNPYTIDGSPGALS